MHEDLIKRLRRCAQFRCRECEYEQVMGCRAKLNEEAADAIEEAEMNFRHLEREYKELCSYLPKWIPVTETLPEPNAVDEYGFAKGYLVKTDRHGMMHTARYTGKWWILWGKAEVITDTVTHWMPLPQAPKEE